MARPRRLFSATGRTPAPLQAGVALALLSLAGACGDEASSRPPSGAPARPDAKDANAAKDAKDTKKSWTTEEMAADPEGYLAWADRQLAAQIELRQQRTASVRTRRAELVTRRGGVATNYADLVNIRKRLETARQKAEDEDRWPVRMGGRTFERAKADAILAEIGRHLDERSPLLKTYDDGIARLDQIAAALNGDVERLTALRDRLAVDLEQVHVSHGVAELEKLRTTEAEITHYAQILGSIAEDAAGTVPNAPPPVDLDQLLQ